MTAQAIAVPSKLDSPRRLYGRKMAPDVLLRLLSAGLLLVLAGCIADSGLGTSTPAAGAPPPGESPLVSPGQSQDVQSLPTAPPIDTGTPIYEINPRGHPPPVATPSPQVTPIPAPEEDAG